MLKKVALNTALATMIGLGLVSQVSMAKSTKTLPKNTFQGYSIINCETSEGDTVRNYCTTYKKELGKVLQNASKIKNPNFDGNKKVVQLFFRDGEGYATKDGKRPLSDTFVVDEKAKKIYILELSSAFRWESKGIKTKPYAPYVYTKKDSNWICLQDEGAYFESNYEQAGAYGDASPENNVLSCVQFKNGQFRTPIGVSGGFDATKDYESDFEWWNNE